MIKINLVKEKRATSSVAIKLSKLQNLKTVKVEDLLKLDKGIYYISAILWIVSVVSVLYYYILCKRGMMP